MNSDTIESTWRAAKRHMTALWSTEDHTAPYGLDTPPVYVVGEKLEVQELFRPASPLARMATRIRAAIKPAMSNKEIAQQKEALSTWEDEGGTAAAPKPKNGEATKK